CFLCGAQTTFQKVYGGTSTEFFQASQQTADGGFIMTGYSNDPIGAGSYDYYLLKTNSYGAVQWKKVYGSTSGDYAYGVNTTSDGGYIVTGATYGFGSGSGGDLWMFKTDASGNVVWSKRYGVGSGADFGVKVRQTNDGGYITTGSTVYGGGYDAYVVKTNSSGAVTWGKRIKGGSSSDCGYDIIQTSSGGYIMAGYCNGIGAGQYDIYIASLSSAGAVLGTRTIGGTAADMAYAIRSTTDGNYIIGAQTNSYGAGSWDMCMVKITPAGSVLWAKAYGSSGMEEVRDVIQTSDGGYALVGVTDYFGAGSDDLLLIKTDANGDTLWTRTYGGSNYDFGYSIQQTSGGQYVIGAYTSSFGAGSYDNYLIKVDANGNSTCNMSNAQPIVTSFTPSTGSGGSNGIQNTSSNASPIVKSPIWSEDTVCSAIILPIELLSFHAHLENNQSVKTEWSTAAEINNNYFAIERSVDAAHFSQIGIVHAAGNSSTENSYIFYDECPYKGLSYYRLRQVDFDGKFAYSNIEAVYIAGLDIINLWPNPASEVFTFQLASSENNKVNIRIRDILGRKVFRENKLINAGTTNIEIDISTLGNAYYTLEVATQNGLYKAQKQLIIQE
ncbi:MAG: T9SS type A sorting domain-containing protein, partial [Flavobacteriales bacterium]